MKLTSRYHLFLNTILILQILLYMAAVALQYAYRSSDASSVAGWVVATISGFIILGVTVLVTLPSALSRQDQKVVFSRLTYILLGAVLFLAIFYWPLNTFVVK